MVHVKICGVRTQADAAVSVLLGASAIGINFVPGSPRRVDVETARSIARAVHGTASATKVLVVGVVANLSIGAMRALQLGANVYITKPIQAPQVISKVKELLHIP